MSSSEHAPFSKESLLEFARQLPFFNLIGLEIVDLGPGWSTTRITYRTDLCQPAGIMHGGMIASLIDTGIAHAILATEMFVALAKEGGHMVSVDLRVKYLRPVGEGVITCEAKIPRLGKHIIHGEAIVTNSEGKEVARGDSIYMTVQRSQLSKKE
ncbi:MAG: PaaI family thioesterase [Planctomycetaceae bacterium]|nr:PaaI family thioesterase [Planctomycetaceae bacterium]